MSPVSTRCGSSATTRAPELGTVTLADLPILPEHVWSTIDPAKAKEVTDLPVGTGPFKLVDYSPTSGYRFEANTNYFAGTPTVGELVMPVIADSSAAFTALSSGQIDAADRALTPELVDRFTASSDIGVITVAPLSYPELKLNFTREPFAQADFRAALNLAVDRDQILDIVGLGQGRPAPRATCTRTRRSPTPRRVDPPTTPRRREAAARFVALDRRERRRPPREPAG